MAFGFDLLRFFFSNKCFGQKANNSTILLIFSHIKQNLTVQKKVPGSLNTFFLTEVLC